MNANSDTSGGVDAVANGTNPNNTMSSSDDQITSNRSSDNITDSATTPNAARMTENNDITGNAEKSGDSSHRRRIDAKDNESKLKPASERSTDVLDETNFTPVCIPCKLSPKSSSNDRSSSTNDDNGDSGSQLSNDQLIKEAQMISKQILHRFPTLPSHFVDHEENDLNDMKDRKPSSLSSSQVLPSTNHLSSHIIDDVLQTPCPFITPSLLCSNENPFIVLQELNEKKLRHNQTSHHQFHIPSIVGTYIDTPIHLLHSIQHIEMDYFDDVSFDSFYDLFNNKYKSNPQSSQPSSSHQNRLNGGGFNMFNPPPGPFASRFQMMYHNNHTQNNDMNSILSNSLIGVLSRVYAMDLSIYNDSSEDDNRNEDLMEEVESNDNIRDANNNTFNIDSNSNIRNNSHGNGLGLGLGDENNASRPFFTTFQNNEEQHERDRIRRNNRRRRLGFMMYNNQNNAPQKQQQHNVGISSTSSTNVAASRNYRLLHRRIRREKHYYETLQHHKQRKQRQSGRAGGSSPSPSSADTRTNHDSVTTRTSATTTNTRLRGINQVLHQFRTTIQSQQSRQNQNQVDNNHDDSDIDDIRQEYHQFISQVIDENNKDTTQQLKQQDFSQEKEKRWNHVMYEERDETIAQLTQLILDESQPYTCSSTSKSSPKQVPNKSYAKYKPSSHAQNQLFSKYNHIPKRVCQHPFKKNDIVWVCRTCQADETCVLCHTCFTNSNHTGHDVAFYHAQAGGCCDCGDEDAWSPRGFCGLHGRRIVCKDKDDGLGGGGNNIGDVNGITGLLEKQVELKVKGLLKSCVEYIRLLACSVEIGYERANGGMILMDECINGKEADSLLHRRSSLSGFKRKNNDSDDGNGDCSVDYESRDMDLSFSDKGSVGQVEQNDLSLTSSTEQFTPMDIDTSFVSPTTTTKVTNNDEFKFDPAAASTSKSRNSSSSNLRNTTNDMMSEDSQSIGFHNTQGQTFNPEYASTSKSRAHISKKYSSSTPSKVKQVHISPSLSRAHQLGLLGSQQDGLYLVVHADDVNENKLVCAAIKELYQSCAVSNSSSSLPRDGIFSSPSINIDTVIRFIPGLFRKKDSPLGDLIVWGPFELMEELGPVLSQCWKDGDATACSRFGALILDKAKILQGKGLVVSIKTRTELCREVRSLAVLELLKMMSDCCDPLCHLVSLALGGSFDDESVSTNSEFAEQTGCLLGMLKNDLKLPRMISKQWHDLLLKLLSEPNFKAALSNAYIDTYSDVTREYSHGVGILERSSYTLSVQFLNRVTYVQDLVRKKDLLGGVIRSLLDTLSVAKSSEENSSEGDIPTSNDCLNTLHSVITDRRYTPCISDLKCVLNVPGIARLFASRPRMLPGTSTNPYFSEKKHCVDAWIQTLALAQNMDFQQWRTESEGHVEIESRCWIGAFNTSISLGSLFERLLMWKDNESLPDNFEDCPMSLLNVIELTQYVLLNGLAEWQKLESNAMFSSKRSDKKLLPMSRIAIAHGCKDKFSVMSFMQKSLWSFHLPLHRFLAACLREVVRRPNLTERDNSNIGILLENLKSLSSKSFEIVQLFNGLIEFPLITLSRTAQIRSKLWRRSGQSMMDQVVNYSEPPFCKSLRDADIMAMQFGLIGNIFLSHEECFSEDSDILHCANFVSLLLERFGITDFVGIHDCTEENERRITTNEPSHVNFDEENTATKDPDRLSSLLEEFLLLLIVFITELPPPQCSDESKHIELAKQRLRREVVHRLASGSKTHSDLSEVHHVLPLQDHVALSEEGMFVNPEDATGAALEAILVEVADCKSVLGKSDKWQLQRWAWNEYDPAFFHISVQSHQDAAENRPLGMGASKEKGKVGFPYAPFPPTAHTSFLRLRKDICADANVVAIIYRVLHIHCRCSTDNEVFDSCAYDSKALSETLVGRALHLLTLGMHSWGISLDAEIVGTGVGSIFSKSHCVPTQQEWVERVFLTGPEEIMLAGKYKGEETMIELIDKLAQKGGAKHFRVEDGAIRAGAAWLRESVVRISPKAAILVGQASHDDKKVSGESDLQRRGREAKERHLKLMQEKMTKFMKQFENENELDMEGESTKLDDEKEKMDNVSIVEKHPSSPDMDSNSTKRRNLQDNLKCAICGCDNNVRKEEHVKSPSKEKKEDVLALCGFLQSSVVLKGGLGLGASKEEDALVGNHISLCGHAIHTSCFESHLKDLSHRSGRQIDSLERGKRPEFRCPVCRRLSNCLVPLIHVDSDWVTNVQDSVDNDSSPMSSANRNNGLHDFLSDSKWWATRNKSSMIWNGRCSFVSANAKEPTRAGRPNEVSSFCKKDLLKAWSSVMSASSLSRIESRTASLENVDDSSSTSTAVAGVWKRLLDHVADVSYKADLKRSGEERLLSNLGEFRHYLVEKNVFNKQNRLAGMGTFSWPACITDASKDSYQEYSKEKLLSKLYQTIQTLTYSCCSEGEEFIRQINTDSSKNTNQIMATFGVASVKCNGRLLVLSTTFDAFDQNEIFNGRIGRLRYFALCTMIATSPLSFEVVQLSMDFPTLNGVEDAEVKARAPIVYPLLCGHILTHVTTVLCASCGEDVLRGNNNSSVKSASPYSSFSNESNDQISVNTLNDCKSFIQLGYIARVLQVSLGFIQEKFCCSEMQWNLWEKAVSHSIRKMLVTNTLSETLSDWEVGCCNLILTALSHAIPQSEIVEEISVKPGIDSNVISEAFKLAKEQGSKFTLEACVIFQVLFPKASSTFGKLNTDCNLNALFDALGISLEKMMDSSLVCQVVRHWYLSARPRLHRNELKKLLDCNRKFKTFDWPLEVNRPKLVDCKGNLPLFQGYFGIGNGKPRIRSLPQSYTDLYSEVGALKPNCESVAVCLVSGQIFNAEGKGECTKHASEYGGGCGIFFLVQKCTSIIIHKDKAAFVMSPYVDSHGEVSHYRGRPLYLDKSRYNSLHEFWSSHLVREKVVSERFNSTMYNLIDNNFY